MTEDSLCRIEQWAWRLLMPALLWGGVMVSSFLFLAGVCRMLRWRRHLRSSPWSIQGCVWPWFFYYGLQVVAGLWSANTGAWLFGLEVKASLLFLPLVAGIPGRPLRKEFWWSVGWSLVVYLTWRLLSAGWHQVVLGDGRFWRYARFAGDIHPTYLSFHAAVAWLGLSRTWGGERWRWGLTLLFALSIGLLASKAGILVALFAAFAERVFSKMMGHGSVRERPVMMTLAFLFVLGLSAWFAARPRFQEMKTAAAVIQSGDAPVASSSSGRVAVWRSSAELLWHNPLGVGTGDVTDELMQIYGRDGIGYAEDRRLNSHNQWLQVGVAVGWPGVLVFSLVFWFWLVESWRRRSVLGLLCGMVVMMHASFESVLEAQRGVVFILWMWVAVCADVGLIRDEQR